MRGKSLPHHLQIGAAALIPGLGYWLLEDRDRAVGWGTAVFGLIGLALILPAGRWTGLTFTIAYILWLIQIGLSVRAARQATSTPNSATRARGGSAAPSYYEQELAEDHAAWQMAREVARPQLEPGERLLKAVVGKNQSSPAEGGPDPVPELGFFSPWYCVVLTQVNLVLIALDKRWKPVDVTRVSFRAGLQTAYDKGWLSDELSFEIPGADRLVLEISDRYRKQTRAIVEVLSQQG